MTVRDELQALQQELRALQTVLATRAEAELDTLMPAYTHWQLGVTRDAGSMRLDLRYYDTDRSVPFFSSPSTARERIVVSLTIPF